MAIAFEESKSETLVERLLRALEAGQKAGGDRRGRASAALKVCDDKRIISLKVDFDPHPIKELRKIISKTYKTKM